MSEKQAPAKWAMDTARTLDVKYIPVSALNEGLVKTLGVSEAALQLEFEMAEIIERESPVGKLTETILSIRNAQSSAEVERAIAKVERVLRELGVEI